MNYLPRMALNCNPPDLSLPNTGVKLSQALVAHTCNLSIGKAEERGLRVQGQPGLHREGGRKEGREGGREGERKEGRCSGSSL
jgi:hypothetical protein